MSGEKAIEWQANWIWGEGEASPRNEWHCFRRTFHWPADRKRQARLSLTADSRYVLYVNGMQVGRGPVRSWPHELAYDTYEIGHLLKPGQINSVAVLVLHFGVSTFYYLRGRGGLLLQLEDEGGPVVMTDASWRTARYRAQNVRTQRMSCQHAFAEWIDARLGDERWIEPDYDDSGWANAGVIGPVGMEPWTSLIPRDIPLLTEEPVQPVRVVSLSRVTPVSWTTTVDMRQHMLPECAEHANAVGYIGFVATVIRVEETVAAKLGFVYTPTNFGTCWVNGVRYLPDAFGGESPEKYLEVQLQAGDNLFVMEVSCVDHGDGFHMGIDCDQPFAIVAPCPVGPDDSALVTIGPFAATAYLDHRRTADPLDPFRELGRRLKMGPALTGPEAVAGLDPALAAYAKAHTLTRAGDLAGLQKWIRPISQKLVCPYDGFAVSIWKRESVPQPVPSVLQNAVIASPDPAIVPVYEGADTEWIVDFGKELSGYLSFELEAAAGTTIDWYGFEHMYEDWRQDTYRLDHTFRYECREGRQTYTSPVRRGLRYVMITVRGAAASAPVRVYGLQLRQSNYPVAEVGRFQCADPLLNEIWRISRHTTRICMEDTFVDCPAYEQTFWVGDSRNEALINYYTFGALDIVKRCMRLVPGSRFQTPLYADQVPSGWNSVIPNWTFFWVTACAEYYLHSGDKAFAEELWPHVKYTLDHYLTYRDEQGLLNMKAWNFLDWAPIDQPNDGIVSHQNMLLTKALRDAALLAECAKDQMGADAFRLEADRLKVAINRGLWAEDREAYRDCIHADGRPSSKFSMQTQVIAHLCGIAEGARLERVAALLDAPPEDFTQIGSPFMSFFHYESMVMAGRFAPMLEDMRRHYGTMVDFDGSACWEQYPGDTPPDPKRLTRSHCHAWSAAPAYFLSAYILGVRAGAPGWETIRIEPQPTGLNWARGVVPLPGGGAVELSWRVNEPERTIALRLGVPAGHRVELCAPQGYRLVTERHEVVGG